MWIELFIDENNEVMSFGFNVNGQLGLGHYHDVDVPTEIKNIKAKQIACGVRQSLIIVKND